MGQAEVYYFLRKNKGEWFSSAQISQLIGQSHGSVSINLRKLRKSKQIEFMHSPQRREMYLYRLQ